MLTSLGTGEAVVTVMNEQRRAQPGRLDAGPGAPGLDVADCRPTRWPPRSTASPLLAGLRHAASTATPRARCWPASSRPPRCAVASSTRRPRATRPSCSRLKEAAAREKHDAAALKAAEKERKAAQAEYERQQREFEKAERAAASTRARRAGGSTRSSSSSSGAARAGGGGAGGVLGDVLGSSAGKTIVREVVKGIFGTLRRR